jgi:uncharacterized protein (DUF58 family)
MNHTELLKKVRTIELKTRRLVDTFFCGEYHSAFKGQGMEFAEVREYQYGDDVRTIDWNVTARAQRPYIKKFSEERELTVMLCVDISASSGFGSTTALRKELLVEIAAMVAFSAIKNNDKVGLLLFHDDVAKVIPPEKGKKHGLRVIRELLTCDFNHQGTDFNPALGYLNKILKRKTSVFILSDFISAISYDQVFRLTSRKHDVIPVVLRDELEQLLPRVGLIKLLDLESNKEVIVNTSSDEFQEVFSAKQKRQKDQLDKLFSRCSTDAIYISQQQSYVEPFMKYFKKREVKR